MIHKNTTSHLLLSLGTGACALILAFSAGCGDDASPTQPIDATAFGATPGTPDAMPVMDATADATSTADAEVDASVDATVIMDAALPTPAELCVSACSILRECMMRDAGGADGCEGNCERDLMRCSPRELSAVVTCIAEEDPCRRSDSTTRSWFYHCLREIECVMM